MTILAHWLLSALAISVTAYMLQGVHVDNFFAALAAAFIFGIVNWTVKPILTILTFPITIVTLGLFSFVVNAFMIMLSAELVPGFTVDNFWWAMLFSLLLAVINYFIDKVFN
jgi:putative membrane protein